MFRICLLYSFLLISCFSISQKNITDAEFFWGTTDPGEGNGVSIFPVDDPITIYYDTLSSTTSWAGDFGVTKGSWKINIGPTNTINTGPNNGYNNSNYFYFESGWEPDSNEVIIYKEDFKNQIGYGATVNGLNTSNVDWNLNINTSNLLNSNDYFKVVSSLPTSSGGPCGSISAPYNQFFSTGVLPTCWTQSIISGSGWIFTGTPGYNAANNGRAAGTYAWIDFSGTDQGTVMELVPINILSISSPEIEFDYFCYNSTNPVIANILYIESFDGTNWVTVNSIQNNTLQGWNSYSFSLTGHDVSGIVSLRLRGESGGASNDYYNDILVDNLSVKGTNNPSPSTTLEYLQARDVNSNAYFFSPNIDISNYTNVEASVNFWETGNLSNFDYVNCEYRIDGGNWTYFAVNSFRNGNFGNVTANQTTLNGDSIQIRITVNVDDNDINLDDIKISGQPKVQNTNLNAVIISEPIYIPNVYTSVDLKFKLHAYGLGIDSLRLALSNDNLIYNDFYSLSSSIHSSSTDDFTNINLDISSFIGDSLWIKFIAKTDHSYNSYLGDVAIDNIEIIGQSVPGLFNNEFEFLKENTNSSPPNDSLVLFNLRIKDISGNWSSTYRRAFFNFYYSTRRELKIISAEYFWNADPGYGNGTAFQVQDGNFNEALESIYKSISGLPSFLGFNLLTIRVKDENGDWGPNFKQTVNMQLH